MELTSLVEEFQPRVQTGMNSQDVVIASLQQDLGSDFQLISCAPPASKLPDIVAIIYGQQVQIEVKRRDNTNSPVKIYEKSIQRGQRDRILDAFARSHSNGRTKSFTEYVDYLRSNSPEVGFPDDEGVGSSRSGKFYVSIEDTKTKSLIRKYLVDSLKANSDDYFAIHTFNTGRVDIYDIGSANNLLQVKKLPNIRLARIETYGGAYKNSMRLAIKVLFS